MRLSVTQPAAGSFSLGDRHALLVGLGGLGSASALYLAGAGIGRLSLCDPDTVDLSNLQRQIIHDTAHIGALKVLSAARRLASRHSGLHVDIVPTALSSCALRALIDEADIVLDGTDNFQTRFLVNRLCVETGTPLISAAAIGFDGQLMIFDHRHPQAPCYGCLFPDTAGDEALRCVDNGVLGPVVGVMGSLQAQAAACLLESAPQANGRLIRWAGLTGRWRQADFARDPGCPCCAGSG